MKYLRILFLLCCVLAIVHCRFYFPFCTKDFTERFCTLENRTAAIECMVELEYTRPIEIFEGCFTSMMYTGEMSLLEKSEKLCKHDSMENEMLKECTAIGVVLHDKRDGKALKIMEECLVKVEKIENKPCYRPEIVFLKPFRYSGRSH